MSYGIYGLPSSYSSEWYLLAVVDQDTERDTLLRRIRHDIGCYCSRAVTGIDFDETLERCFFTEEEDFI